jgi:hypothetical protein
MSIFSRRVTVSSVFGRRSPSCRGGASSLLRLTQAGSAAGGSDVVAWLSRAAQALTQGQPGAAPAALVMVRPSEFAPSQWLAGH